MLHIVEYGLGKPLVLFHGWGFDNRIWHSLLAPLEHHFHLYLVDLPGFGLTPPMSWEIFKHRLLTVLPRHFALAGWSMGGLLATQLALEHPERVSQLYNIASTPRFIQDDGWPGVDRVVFQNFYQRLKETPQETLLEFITLQTSSSQASSLGATPASLEGLQAGLNLLLNSDIRRDLHKLTMPVCYLFGRLDAIISSHTYHVMKVEYPHLHVVLLPRAAHAPFLSHTEECARLLCEFLL